MATRTKAPAKKAAAPLSNYQDKAPTALHEEFLAWLEDHTGIKGLDLKSVQLATVLRGDFQKSDVNRQRLASAKQAKVDRQAEIAKNKKDREEARAKAAKEKAAAKAKAPAKTAAKAPAKTAAKPAAKKAPAKTSTAPRRRAAAKPKETF